MQPDIVCLQEHNQHSLVKQQGYFGGYDIFYARTTAFSGVYILVRHELQPQIAYNDCNGRWMVFQCIINGDDSLLRAKNILQTNDHRKLQKSQIRARKKPLMDKGAPQKLSSRPFMLLTGKIHVLESGNWMDPRLKSFSELQDECLGYFDRLFSSSGSLSPQAIDARNFFL